MRVKVTHNLLSNFFLLFLLSYNVILLLHCKKNHIFFFQMFWKDGLSKKIALEYDLSCIIRKDDISFSRKYDLILLNQEERWSFSKKYLEMWCFLQMFRKDGFPKKFALEYDLFCNIWKDGISFSPKLWFSFLSEKWKKMIFLEKYTEIWYFLQAPWKDGISKKGRTCTWSFLYYLERWYFFPQRTWSFFPGQKVKDCPPQEIHGDMMHRQRRKTGNLIYRVEV